MLKPYTCPHCGEEFDNRSDLMTHLRIDNCKSQVEQEIEIYESRNGEAHQADLADYADWGSDLGPPLLALLAVVFRTMVVSFFQTIGVSVTGCCFQANKEANIFRMEV